MVLTLFCSNQDVIATGAGCSGIKKTSSVIGQAAKGSTEHIVRGDSDGTAALFNEVTF
ncbi:hypothetical protein Brsp01_50730 [Brucella sp. NBRC 12950]|nr:hypothetical protein Brsp01_50730 [Brucella sp. NBRC 12950]